MKDNKKWRRSKDGRLAAGLRYQRWLLDNQVRLPTSAVHEEIYEQLLLKEYEVIKEAIFPPYFIDCYDKDLHIGIEVDGEQHYRSKDKRKDEVLWETYRLPIFRIKVKKYKKDKQKIWNEFEDFVEEYSDDVEERIKYREGVNFQEYEVAF